MPQRALDAQAIMGQDRNRAHGEVDGQLVPYRVYNLAPHRAGGYAPYGRRVRLQDGAPADVTLPDVVRLIGHDETGVSSYSTSVSTPGSFRVFRGTALHAQATPSYQSPGDAVHLANAGAYSTRKSFLVLNRDRRAIEPIDVNVSGVATAGQPATTTVVAGISDFIDVAYGNGNFIAITRSGLIYRSGDDGKAWAEVANYTGGFHGLSFSRLESIDYGGGVWLACDSYYRVLRSTDDGDTWAIVNVLPPVGGNRAYYQGLSTPVGLSWASYSSGDTWYATGRGGGIVGADGVSREMGVLKSTDGGETWASVDDLQQFGFPSRTYWGTRVAPGPAVAAVMTREGKPYVDIDAGGDDFTPVSGSATAFDGWDFTFAVSDRFVALHASGGQVATSQPWTSDPTAIGEDWGITATLDGHLNKGSYDPGTGTITIVGGADRTYASDRRIWQGDSIGSLERATKLETAWTEAGGSMVHGVAFSDAGVAVYVGNHADGPLVMSTDVSPGLSAGTYSLYYLTYANTPAGRLVLGLQREVRSFTDDNNRIAIQAQTMGTIIGNNAWLNALPIADAEAIVGDMRLDVYIQYAASTADVSEDEVGYSAATAEYTVRYAFTAPFPETGAGPSTVGRTLGQLPIGRQLVAGGAPTTAIFEKSRTDADDLVRSRTAIHNGRVWGLARQDEEPWGLQGDNISLEIANQFNRFVLTYTEVGWANLVSDQSFIPLQPQQSTNFTGILGTPSGLMVMFDNEIILVAGDPAFGNVSVDTYLDMVGCDLGTTPCMMGGLPFVIWDGKIWALQAGQAQEVSRSQWRPDDRFVRICSEPQTRSLIGITESGAVLRYLVDEQFWLTDPITRDAFAALEVLPNFIDPKQGDGETGRARVVDTNGNVWVTYRDGVPDSPHLVYRGVDFGSPERRTPVYTAKVTVEGAVARAEYDRNAAGYDATLLPAMFYGSANASNGTTYESYNPQAGGLKPYGNPTGSREVQTLVFRFPRGNMRAYSADLRLEARGVEYADIVKLPIRFFYAAGGAVR